VISSALVFALSLGPIEPVAPPVAPTTVPAATTAVPGASPSTRSAPDQHAANRPASASSPPLDLAPKSGAAFGAARAELEASLVPAPHSADELREILLRRWGDERMRDALDDAIERYRRSIRQADERIRRPLAARIDAAFEWDAGRASFEPHAGPELVLFEQERASWNLALDEAERTLLRTLDRFPAAADAAPRGAVHAAIERKRHGRSLSSPLAAIEPDELAAMLPASDAALLRSVPDFDAWRESRVNALRERRETLDRWRERRAQALAELGPFAIEQDDPRKIRFEREIESIRRQESATEFEIEQLNESALRNLRGALPIDAAASLDRAIASMVHPEVLESERSIRVLADSLLAEPTLTAESRDAVAAVIGQFELRLASPRAALLKALAAQDFASRWAAHDRGDPAQLDALGLELDLRVRSASHRQALRSLGRDLQRFVPPTEPDLIERAAARLRSLESLERRDEWRAAMARAEIAWIRHGRARAAAAIDPQGEPELPPESVNER